MSRIGLKPIECPEGVEVNISSSSISVKGPKGELVQDYDPAISFNQEGNLINVKRSSELKDHKSKHGLYRSLVANMVEGVSKGFKKELELFGVGYRANLSGNLIEFSLGYSHSIFFQVPPEVKVQVIAEKGKNPIVSLECHDKQLLGQVAAKIKSLRKVEPYKGKGIKYLGEYVRRKAGKTAAK
jgi:large subunit ribosomal protein L6